MHCSAVPYKYNSYICRVFWCYFRLQFCIAAFHCVAEALHFCDIISRQFYTSLPPGHRFFTYTDDDASCLVSVCQLCYFRYLASHLFSPMNGHLTDASSYAVSVRGLHVVSAYCHGVHNNTIHVFIAFNRNEL